MAAHLTVAAEIRKLRKKLRQIENLERLTRPLDELEESKVSRKYDIREQLQDLLDRVDTPPPASTQTHGEQAQSSSPSPPLPERVEGHAPTLAEGGMEGRKGGGDVASVQSGGGKVVTEEGDVKSKLPAPEKHQSSTTRGPDAKAAEKKKGKKSQGDRGGQWRGLHVVVSELEGHSDLVTSVSVRGNTLLSASRDTTVRVWNVESGQETYSLGGHTETVTCVLLLSPEETALLQDAQDGPEDSYIVSGSTDCTFKMWSLKSGQLVRSVYTFNPVTCLDYSYSAHLLVTASDGGKVELWDVKTGQNVFSVRAHDEAVTGVKVVNNTVITSDAAGLVMVHEVRDGSLVRVFVSEDVKCAGSGRVNLRRIRCLTASDRTVVIGDDACNLKLLDWKKGVVSKAVNHVSEFSSTDAVCLWEDVLLSSSYDLDRGYGYINVRSLDSGDYLASLDDEEVAGTDRVVCLAATRGSNGQRVIISGGPQLKVWRLLPPGHSAPDIGEDEEKWVTVTQFLPALAQAAGDSEAESDLEEGEGEESDDDNDDEDDIDEKGGDEREVTSWMSWCSIV